MNNYNIGIIGLGVMGQSLAKNMLSKGFSVAVYNRATAGEEHIVNDFLSQLANEKAIVGTSDLSQFVNALQAPRSILLMIKAGPAVDSVINELKPMLSAGDVIIDGGNSYFQDSERRFHALKNESIEYIGCGISGGEEGALKGPSMMPGGSSVGYEKVAKILESIAAKDLNGDPCCGFIAQGGAGHFIKMVHNGIEYGEMQLLAECYHLLKQQLSYEEIASTFESWYEGDQASFLLEITIDILKKREGMDYLLDLILDQAGNKGTGSLSSQSALQAGLPTTIMTEAVFSRYLSFFKEKRKNLSQLISRKSKKIDINTAHLKNAYRFARLINHHQGFELIQNYSDQYHWNLDLSSVARIWTNGCIIRSSLMQDLTKVFKEEKEMLQHSDTFNQLKNDESDLRIILQMASECDTPTPALSSAFQYWLGMTTDPLPANLIQAQRDYFGAHTYQRLDAEHSQFYHTNWKENA